MCEFFCAGTLLLGGGALAGAAVTKKFINLILDNEDNNEDNNCNKQPEICAIIKKDEVHKENQFQANYSNSTPNFQELTFGPSLTFGEAMRYRKWKCMRIENSFYSNNIEVNSSNYLCHMLSHKKEECQTCQNKHKADERRLNEATERLNEATERIKEAKCSFKKHANRTNYYLKRLLGNDEINDGINYGESDEINDNNDCNPDVIVDRKNTTLNDIKFLILEADNAEWRAKLAEKDAKYAEYSKNVAKKWFKYLDNNNQLLSMYLDSNNKSNNNLSEKFVRKNEIERIDAHKIRFSQDWISYKLSDNNTPIEKLIQYNTEYGFQDVC